jgi:flagellar export protein FliJ
MVRKKTLKDEQTKLASILSVFNKQTEKIQKMILELDAFKKESENYLQGSNFNPLTVSNYAMYAKKLQEDIELQKTINEKTKEVLDIQQQTVKKAYIGVKSLENLESKQKEQYLKEIQLEEIKEIDDIVNSRRIIA